MTARRELHWTFTPRTGRKGQCLVSVQLIEADPDTGARSERVLSDIEVRRLAEAFAAAVRSDEPVSLDPRTLPHREPVSIDALCRPGRALNRVHAADV